MPCRMKHRAAGSRRYRQEAIARDPGFRGRERDRNRLNRAKNTNYHEQARLKYRERWMNDPHYRELKKARNKAYQRERRGYQENPVCVDCGAPVTRIEGRRAPERCPIHRAERIRFLKRQSRKRLDHSGPMH